MVATGNAVSFDNLPGWLKDNEFLHHNHRPPMYSFRGCAKSLFRMHTETMNIWTHLLGAVFFVLLLSGVFVYGDYITHLFEDLDVSLTDLPWHEQVIMLFFFVGAILCLLCSCLFHLFSNHSKEKFYVFSRLDFSGIAFMITGSSVPAYYYAFYCSTAPRLFHITILLLLCIACVAISFWPKFSTPKYRPLRFGVFVLFGLYGIIPSVHCVLLKGFFLANQASPLGGLIAMGLIYIAGACVYVLRIPERFFPGKFDVWAHSHQLFHVCVIAAALLHYNTLLDMVKYRLGAGGCTLPVPVM